MFIFYFLPQLLLISGSETKLSPQFCVSRLVTITNEFSCVFTLQDNLLSILNQFCTLIVWFFTSCLLTLKISLFVLGCIESFPEVLVNYVLSFHPACQKVQ